MPSPPTTDLPRPKSWDEFEDIVADVMKVKWNDPNVTRVGRSGQTQNGVDIYGMPEHLGRKEYAGAQCKKKSDEIEFDDVVAIVTEAEEFKPPLAELVIATTAPRDEKLQVKVRELNVQRVRKDEFRVEVAFWEDLSLDLSGEPRLLAKHFPGWSKVADPAQVARIDVGWIVDDDVTKTLKVDALPWGVRDFKSAFSPFKLEELEYIEKHAEQSEVKRAHEYNALVEAKLKDEGVARKWFESKRRGRFDHGTAVGVGIAVDDAPAEDILVRLVFDGAVEIFMNDDPPDEVEAITFPERPKLSIEKEVRNPLFDVLAGFDARIDLGLPDYEKMFKVTFPQMRPVVTLAKLQRRRTIYVEDDHEVVIRVQSMSPRRVARFVADESVKICPLVKDTKLKVQWTADARSLPAELSGELEVEVGPSHGDYHADWVGPPIEVTSYKL
jgi:hypothetical protein